jgi:riboflavin kinase/FMN adenylyltransferase
MPVLEVHLFNFSQDIYAQRLEVDFRHKIREEKKFKNLDMLKSQIKKDIALAKTLLQK